MYLTFVLAADTGDGICCTHMSTKPKREVHIDCKLNSPLVGIIAINNCQVLKVSAEL